MWRPLKSRCLIIGGTITTMGPALRFWILGLVTSATFVASPTGQIKKTTDLPMPSALSRSSRSAYPPGCPPEFCYAAEEQLLDATQLQAVWDHGSPGLSLCDVGGFSHQYQNWTTFIGDFSYSPYGTYPYFFIPPYYDVNSTPPGPLPPTCIHLGSATPPETTFPDARHKLFPDPTLTGLAAAWNGPVDPTVAAVSTLNPIPIPFSSTGSTLIRLGNTTYASASGTINPDLGPTYIYAFDQGAEAIAMPFTVDATMTNFSFHYAIVEQDPSDHTLPYKPRFIF